MSAPFFITSPGTGLGKTLVTSALSWQLRQQRKHVTALKPVISGFDPDDAQSDTALILRSCGISPTPETIRAVSPWRFAAPEAPSLAAREEGQAIALDPLAAFCREHAGLKSDVVLVEGCGGVMTPLDGKHTVLDWMEQLGWPVILVAGSYLGTLSHTLTAMETLTRRGLKLQALVVSDSGGGAARLDDTVSELGRFVGEETPVVKLPRLRPQAEMWKDAPPIHWMCA